MSRLNILSIDGGGVHGIIPARILQEIETRANVPICELFDIAIGNSTGGLIALALGKPDVYMKPQYTAKDLVQFYKTESHSIFRSSIWRNIQTGWSLWGPKYDRRPLDQALAKILGATTLSQSLYEVYVPFYDVLNQRPYIMSSAFGKNNKANDFYLFDAAAATSAAPTLFKPHSFWDPTHSVQYKAADGGIYANNPELMSIIAAYTREENVSRKDVQLVTIGTGDLTLAGREPNISLEDEGCMDDGIVDWLVRKHLIKDMMRSESLFSDYVVHTLFPNTFRLQVKIPKELEAIDKADAIPLLLQYSEDYIQQHSSEISLLVDILVYTKRELKDISL